VRLELKYPAAATSAPEHAQVAVELFRSQFDWDLDFTPFSLEAVDERIELLREEGHSTEELAEALFVLGCYLGEVIARALGGRWVATRDSTLAAVSPWPMVVALSDGSVWDVIGKVFRRFELGDSEYLPAFFAVAGGRLG
jgi:hypothetical protein